MVQPTCGCRKPDHSHAARFARIQASVRQDVAHDRSPPTVVRNRRQMPRSARLRVEGRLLTENGSWPRPRRRLTHPATDGSGRRKGRLEGPIRAISCDNGCLHPCGDEEETWRSSSSPCSVLVPRTSAIPVNPTTSHDTSNSRLKQRKRAFLEIAVCAPPPGDHQKKRQG